MEEQFELDPIKRLTKDLKKAAATLSDDEARYLVSTYYQMQSDRIRSNNQVAALAEAEEPHAVLGWFAENANLLEGNIKRALGAYADARPVGRWSQTICGIGPVLSAGLLAHIDITKAPTVGHIWRFAGLDPTVTWEKKSKRPWNAALKVLCFKIGESFVKVSGNEHDTYGKLYVERKVFEQTRNESGALAEQAAAKLVKFKIGKDTDAYKAYSTGKLPPAHIHARAKRWAVKLFLSHFQEASHFAHYGVLPPRPYILTREGGHAHDIQPPYMELIPGWAEARAKAGI